MADAVGSASGTGTAAAVGTLVPFVVLSGEAILQFVGTTEFIALIESGTGLLSYGAELHLRSL